MESTRIAELTAKIDRDTADLQMANDRADPSGPPGSVRRGRRPARSRQRRHRLAGVYAMAQLADDWADPDARRQCVAVLCAYLRMP